MVVLLFRCVEILICRCPCCGWIFWVRSTSLLWSAVSVSVQATDQPDDSIFLLLTPPLALRHYVSTTTSNLNTDRREKKSTITRWRKLRFTNVRNLQCRGVAKRWAIVPCVCDSRVRDLPVVRFHSFFSIVVKFLINPGLISLSWERLFINIHSQWETVRKFPTSLLLPKSTRNLQKYWFILFSARKRVPSHYRLEYLARDAFLDVVGI